MKRDLVNNSGFADEPLDLELLKALYKAKGRVLSELLLITADNRILDLESEEGKKELRRIFAEAIKPNQVEADCTSC